MSAPILKSYVDERGNISVRVSQDVTVLTQEEAERIEAEYKRMQVENAKLRELVKSMYYDLTNMTFPPDWVTDYEADMRELGVEVDDGTE